MKHIYRPIIFITTLAVIFYSCEKEKEKQAQVPVVSTLPAENVDTVSAILKAKIDTDGGAGITEKGFHWSDDNNNIEKNTIIVEEIEDSIFMAELEGLIENTIYFFRAFATNNTGISTGDIINFTTDSVITENPIDDSISLTTLKPVALSPTSLSTGGKILSPGGLTVISRGICWDTVPEPTIEDNKLENAGDIDSFLINITDLQAANYYIRAFAKNSKGVYYGDEIFFPMFYFMDNRDKKLYKYTTIGSQTWMAENLAYLPEVCVASEDCGYWVMGFEGSDAGTAKFTLNYQKYGVLYSFNIAETVCPEGWHLPSDEEWKELVDYINLKYNGTGAEALKAETGWGEEGNGRDAFRFRALPGGFRSTLSYAFADEGYAGYWWSSDFNVGEGLKNRVLHADGDNLEVYFNHSTDGCYVRCIKDEN
jgi:uncharacterized protein (TIGR02145 family)